MTWQELYRDKVNDADDAVRAVESGARVWLGGGAGVPTTLVDALMRRAGELRDVEILHILHFGEAPYAAPEMAESFRHNALFIGPNVREAVQEGRADATPAFLGEIPDLLRGPLRPDVALVQVTPPDEHGWCSLGAEVGCTKPAAEAARVVIAEVNRNTPRTHGDAFLHMRDMDMVCVADEPMPETRPGGHDPVHAAIADHIVPLIPDGATLQMGIGKIPDAVLARLGDHRDLGVHTELFSDGIIDLVEEGVITGARKTLHPGKVVAGFLFGTRRLYETVDDNPAFELHPTDYVNDPFIIAQHDRMVAINSALEVDLTGQVAADSIGVLPYSGVGGQVDFIRGAARSKGGVPIIAMRSKACQGTVSRIVPVLKEGAGVTTGRADVRWVVTEHGAADLHGLTLAARARALIDLAAPEFRDDLKQAARRRLLL